MLDIPQSDAIVIGAGPNGLAAAIVMAQAGCSVTVLEANQQIGGGARSAALTLPGFVHDLCSAVYPLGVGSPFFRTLPLREHGLEWVHAELPLAHPLDGREAAVLQRSLDASAERLGEDARGYRKLIGPLAENWPSLAADVLGLPRRPRYPLAVARFGLNALRSARGLAESVFRTEAARALFAGNAAHSMLPLEATATAGFALVLMAAGHAVGWPFARGGAQSIPNALASYLRSLGGTVITGCRVESLHQLPPARAVLCDITPRQLLRMAEPKLPPAYRTRLARYRYGPGVFKVDWALSGPIPWRDPLCRRAGTVHLGGSIKEIAASERAVARGQHARRPFVLVAQPTLFDPTRAPAGAHTVWAYCHVPNGSTVDMLDAIEAQIERFAPGFRRVVLARSVRTTRDLEAANANLVGGDINGGAGDIRQLFTRPTWREYATPVKGLYLCSSSTPPGGGVHGMCGYAAAKLALARI